MAESLTPEFTPSPSPVQKTPISRKIHMSSKMLPGVACMHKLPLREFQESDPCPLRKSDPCPLRSNSSTPMPSLRRPRSSSMSSLGDSSSGDMTRPSSQARAASPWQEAGPDPTRPLSRHEVRERTQDAVDWFRASHAINYHSRPLEETEAILAAARERRSRGAIVRRCPKVEKVDDIDVESVNDEDT